MIRTSLLTALVAGFVALASWSPGNSAFAQTAEALGDGPLSLDAADGVEWRQEERVFIAEGDAVASQGQLTLKADRLIAAYRENEEEKIQIFRIDAEGAVDIKNGDDRATGNRASFDLETRDLVLTGSNVSYKGAAGEVRAAKAIRYNLNTRKAVAEGRARVVDEDGSIVADQIEAVFADDENQSLEAAIATGNVRIETPDGVVEADRARYNFKDRKAVATGKVKLRRGKNVLEGGEATVDFASGISRLSGARTADGGRERVRGLIFPQASD